MTISQEYFWLRNAAESILQNKYFDHMGDRSSVVIPLSPDPATDRMRFLRRIRNDDGTILFEIYLGK